MYNLKLKTYLQITFFISLFSIFSAYFIEYILGHQPCNLCLIERIPYGLSVFFLILNNILRKNEKFIILLLILIFAFSLIISTYHFAIEQGFLEESAVCGLQNTSNIISKDELLKQLQLKTISCKDVTFRIFDLSLTTYNMILSLFMFLITLKIYLITNYDKK
jgi:disulfide bond formation protein DsbB